MARALIVDDEPQIRSLMTSVLRRNGYDVLEANDGVDACQVVERESGALDVVVTDIKMPRMDGLELAQKLRELHPRIPVLFVSGFIGPESGLDVPESRFLAKPFKAAVLVCKVRSLISSADFVSAG